jgi:anti-sigma factor RsiW
MSTGDAGPRGEHSIIDMGTEPAMTPRPVRWRPLLAALALLVAAALGYVIGDRHGRSAANAPTPNPPAQTPIGADDIAPTGVTCSEQVGSTLRLGARVANRSTRIITLDGIGVELSSGALDLIGTAWGECVGDASAPPGGITLAPGEATWVSATVAVKVPCPDFAPVIFHIDFDEGRGTAVAGFNDLAEVPYTGCSPSPR